MLSLALFGAGPLTPTLSANAAPSAARWPGGDCPDVRVLFARGSGEKPLSSSDPAHYTAEINWGMGSVGGSLRSKLNDITADTGLTIGYEGVVYDALPVPLFDSATWGDSEAMTKYRESVNQGAAAIRNRMGATKELWCANARVPVILGGYSQGAWAVRRALNQMSSEELEMIDGVVLFGDPTKRWREPIVRWRRLLQMPLPEGIAITSLQATSEHDVAIPTSIQPRTSSFCIPGDVICGGWDFTTIQHRLYGVEATQKAAQFLRPNMPVAPAQLPTTSQAAETYTFLRGGSRDVIPHIGDGFWDPPGGDCLNSRDFTALSGRWASYETRSHDMPYFIGLQDPGAWIFKFRTAGEAAEAFRGQRDFVERCGGWHHAADGSFQDWHITADSVPRMGQGTVAYRRYMISENVLTDYSESRYRSIKMRKDRLQGEVDASAENFMPSKDKLIEFARAAIRRSSN